DSYIALPPILKPGWVLKIKMSWIKKIFKSWKESMIRASLDDSFIQYKAVTISIAVGTFLSLFVFVLFLGQGLESHKQEFRSIAQSELSFIQKELEDLESSLNDAYFYMKTQADMKLSDLEILFRNEMRNRL